MGDPLWLNRVREQLARHNLPPSYVERFIEELVDHLEDLEEENVEADLHSRLGEPEQVADAAVATYRRRSFLGRHPSAAFLVFAVSPLIPQYLLGMVLMLVSGVFTGNYLYEEHDLGLSLTIILCSTFVGILYGELALRLGLGTKWMLASFAVLATMAAFWEYGLNHGSGLLAARLPVQLALPLAVGWWFAKRKFNHTYPVTNFFIFAVSPVVSFVILWVVLSVLISYLMLVALYLAPTAAASLLYCSLTKGFGWDRKWVFVSSTVLAIFAAMASFRLMTGEWGVLSDVPVGLTIAITLVQFFLPLAIAWWFTRRKPDQSPLELAS
jgi:hypothetical protein